MSAEWKQCPPGVVSGRALPLAPFQIEGTKRQISTTRARRRGLKDEDWRQDRVNNLRAEGSNDKSGSERGENGHPPSCPRLSRPSMRGAREAQRLERRKNLYANVRRYARRTGKFTSRHSSHGEHDRRGGSALVIGGP
jgi:hypothetical protein